MRYSLLLLAACAPKAIPSTPMAASVEVVVDAASLFGGRASSSVIDRRLVTQDLLARIGVDPLLVDVQSSDVPVEFWARQQLVAHLGRRDSILVLHEHDALPVTAWLRGLRFVSGEDPVAVSVHQEGGEILLYLAGTTETESLCPEGFELPVAYVQLEAVVERADGAAVGWLSETAIPEPRGEMRHSWALPPVGSAGFCDALRHAVVTSEELQPGATDYAFAAQQVLDGAFGPLVPIEDLP